MSWIAAVAIARVLADQGSPPPDVDDPAVLLVKRHDVSVGCSPGDAGVPDAGPVADAAPDAGAPADAGALADAGTPADAADAGTMCTMIPGDAVTMIVDPHIHASTALSHFAMLYVTPSRPVVEVSTDPFGSLPWLTAPTHVVHEVDVVDPSLAPVCEEDTADGCGGTSDSSNDDGCGGGGTWDPPGYGGGSDTPPNDGGVVVQMVGPYEVIRVHPADRAELVQWLDSIGFAYETQDVDAVVPYLARDYYVVAARLAPQSFDTQTALAITWAGSDLRLPIALAAARDAGSTLTVYVAADGTYATPGAHIVFSDVIASMQSLGSTYITRFEMTVPNATSPDEDPVATRLFPDQHHRDEIVDTKEVHVPPTTSCYDEEPHGSCGCCGDCQAERHRVRLDMIVLALSVMIVIRRRRRRR